MATKNTVDTSAEDAFTARIKEATRGAWLTLGLSLGQKLGLFTVMSELDHQATSEEIATKSNCKERYVREWLYLMTSHQVVEMSPDSRLFFLPPQHRPTLSASQPFMLGSIETSMFGEVFLPLAEAFKNDGPLGVSSSFGYNNLNFCEEMRDYDTLSTEFIGQVPGMTSLLEQGIDCCDLGGGRGRMVIHLAQKYPKSHFTSCDINEKSLTLGLAEAEKIGLKNVSFLNQDVCNLPSDWTSKFDYVLAVEMLHDLPFPVPAAKEMFRVVKPGGVLSVLDVNCDADPQKIINGSTIDPGMYYTYSLYYCLSQSLAVEGSAGLGCCTGYQTLCQILNEGGFDKVDLQEELKDNKEFCHLLCRKPLD